VKNQDNFSKKFSLDRTVVKTKQDIEFFVELLNYQKQKNYIEITAQYFLWRRSGKTKPQIVEFHRIDSPASESTQGSCSFLQFRQRIFQTFSHMGEGGYTIRCKT
jgi:hypothetical protein